MRKNVIKIVSIASVIIMQLITMTYAHGGNITGYKDKNSDKITKKDNEYYGYHKEDGQIHYHKVDWNEEKKRWQIKNSSIYYDENFNVTKDPNSETEKIQVTLNSTVDGDTAKFNLNNEIITVRFLAVDTPETKHPDKGVEPYGPEASAFTKEKLTNAKKIVLEYDGNSTKTDKYNRHLAWIWVDGELLQELLIEKGLAKVDYIYGDYKYLTQLQEKEKLAKENKVGRWKNEIETLQTEQVVSNEQKVEVVEKKNERKIEEWGYVVIVVLVLLIGIIVGKKKR